MTCGSCANRVQRTLRKQPGVAGADVNFATATARVLLEADGADAAALEAAVAKAGYELQRPDLPADSADSGEDDSADADEDATQR